MICKIQATAGKILQKGCNGKTAESQAGTNKSKITNTKLLAPSLA